MLYILYMKAYNNSTIHAWHRIIKIFFILLLVTAVFLENALCESEVGYILKESSDEDVQVSNNVAFGIEGNFPGTIGLTLTWWIIRFIGTQFTGFYLDDGSGSVTSTYQGKIFFCIRSTKIVRTYVAYSVGLNSYSSSSGTNHDNSEGLFIGCERFSTLKNPKYSYSFEVGFGKGYSNDSSMIATGLGFGVRLYF